MLRFLRGGGASVLLLVMWIGLGGVSGCGTGGKPAEPADGMSVAEQEEAMRMLDRLDREYSPGKGDEESLALAEEILTRYPSFSGTDLTLLLGTHAAVDVGASTQAFTYVDRLLAEYPGNPGLAGALDRCSELALAEGDTLRGADYLAILFDRDPSGQTGPDGQPRAAAVFLSLDADQLGQLRQGRSGSPLSPYLGFLQTDRLLEEGRVAEAEEVVLELESGSPGNEWTLAARNRLGGGRGPSPVAGEIRPHLVGVICPLTGRYAVLGNAFFDAALLAVEVTNAELETSFELKVEDSEGDPVAAALAARHLCREEGSIALLGALMSDPTAAVAIMADQWQVPLVSPTATNERIWELGEGIFQTNLTGLFETRLLASLVTTVMLKDRFGILYPDTPEGRGYADVFRSEVEALGGEIVAEASFPSRGTDFKDPILAVRKNRPEVLFVPATVDQMVLLGPQLDFYHAGSLVLGLSNWNSDKLRERSQTVLERAIFPSDVALFPGYWTSEFRSRWNGENYPREASVLALKAYQATRMLLDTLAGSEATSRVQLTHALRNRLASRGFETEGPDSFATSVRMFQAEGIVPFPAGRFTEAWHLTEGIAADSLSVESEDRPEEEAGD